MVHECGPDFCDRGALVESATHEPLRNAIDNPLRYIDPKGLDVTTYDEFGNESERQKQSKWHNLWFGR